MATIGPQRYTALLERRHRRPSARSTYGGHNQTVRYDGVHRPSWLIEASFARARTTSSRFRRSNEWSVTDDTVTPHQPSGGIGFYEVGNQSTNWQYARRRPTLSAATRSGTASTAEHLDYINTINRTGPTFTLPDGTQTATGAEIEILPDPTFGQIYRVTRANTRNVADTTQNYDALFVQDTWKVGRRLTINPGLRYEQQTADWHAGGRLKLKQQLGAADRRHVGSDRRGQDEGLRQLGLVFHAHAERSGGARAVG